MDSNDDLARVVDLIEAMQKDIRQIHNDNMMLAGKMFALEALCFVLLSHSPNEIRLSIQRLNSLISDLKKEIKIKGRPKNIVEEEMMSSMGRHLDTLMFRESLTGGREYETEMEV